jgi:uncharacterized repeat protein (TIGR01451 family)
MSNPSEAAAGRLVCSRIGRLWRLPAAGHMLRVRAVRIRKVIPALSVVVGLLAGGAALRAEDGADAPGEQGAPTAMGSGPLVTETVVELLEREDEAGLSPGLRFVAAERIGAGDEVYYTIRVSNPGRAPVREVVVTKRLPYGMLYARGSAVGPAADVQFSVDGGATFAPASQLDVAPPGQARRRAGPADYTHVRWRLRYPLAAGATALLRFRATLS